MIKSYPTYSSITYSIFPLQLKFNDEVSLILRKATEEEEKEFLDKAIEFMKKRRDFTRGKNNNKRFGRKRHGGHDNRHNKKQRSE